MQGVRWARLAAAVEPAGRSRAISGGHLCWSGEGRVLAVYRREADLPHEGCRPCWNDGLMPRSEAHMIGRARRALTTSVLARALENWRLVLGPAAGPRWRSWPAVPESVRLARRFVGSVLAEVAESDADHVDDVVLVASELVTNSVNAVREATGPDAARAPAASVQLGIAVAPRWTHLHAVDTSPALPREVVGDSLARSGRGIPIIKNLAAMTWVELSENDKTIHVIVTRTGVELTPEDRKTLGPRV